MKPKILLILLFFCGVTFSQLSIYQRWHETDLLIRDRKIDKDDAIDSIAVYVEQSIKELKSISSFTPTKRSDWVYPLSGWTWNSYREKGQDYRDSKFDYFQGGDSKGHPAHDIFILDRDSNTLEDSTGEKVKALSMVNGVIVSAYGDWKLGSLLRSGNYVKIFDPETKALFYYSHLDTVFVKPGYYVKAGEPVGYVGRTGRKAVHGRTHLHIAYYKIYDGYPKPVNIISDLYSAERK